MDAREIWPTNKSLRIAALVMLIGPPSALPQTLQRTGQDARIERVLTGLRPPIVIKGREAVRWTLDERMKATHVPGVSVAVIDEDRIAWARGFGVKETGRPGEPVTASTLFEAQSISKAVASTATLALVSTGKLALDEPVNRYLRSWKVPENELQANEKVTLRRILSHSAGLTVGGFSGYRYGDALPSLVQILNGEKPANNPPVEVDVLPGSVSRYSGGGFEAMQQLLMDVTGQPFPELMKRLVLQPTGMNSSTYEQPLPKARWSDAASGHDKDGAVIKGRWPIQPELAAGGLWTTPSDLAKWALAVTDAWSGTRTTLLSQRVAKQMLTIQKAPFGLGVELDGDGQTLQFLHSGSNAGYRAMLVMFPAAGKGAVIMTNGDGGEGVIGSLLASIAAEYHWPGWQQVAKATVVLSDAQINNIVGVYSLPPAPSGGAVTYEVTRSGDRIFGQIKGLDPRPETELFPASPSSFFGLSGMVLDFVLDDSGKATTLKLGPITGVRR